MIGAVGEFGQGLGAQAAVDWSGTMKEGDLVARYIRVDPDWPTPAHAYVAGHGVDVWALVGYMRAVDGDIDRVAADYDLPREAVEAAVAYYRQHQNLIDAVIAMKTIPAA